MMKFGIGILGATGYIGVPYRKEIRECGENIVALCARRRDRLEAAGAEDGAVLLTDDWREVVEHPDVNLVLVLTPDALHYEPVLRAAELGKHVFCEKPVGVSTGQAAEMLKAVEATRVATYVPFWTRYVPVFRQAKSILDEGRLGDIKLVVYRWHNPRPLSMPYTWRDDPAFSAAGSIADVGSHAYDMMRFLLGKDAQRVLANTDVLMPPKPQLGEIDLQEAIDWGVQNDTASAVTTQKGGVPDYGQVLIEFEGDAKAALTVSHASYLRKGFAPELELHGTFGSLSVNRVTGELLFADSPDPAKLIESIPDEGFGNRFEKYVFPALREQLAGESCAHPQMGEGYKVQLFIDAVMRSSNEGGWVSV